jgi:hypothetical protein
MKIRRSRFILSLYALFVAGSVATLFAVDGVILIDQNRALAGNVTPGDAPGFPVTITQPGSYRLSGNLTVPADASGIVIQADHVTLDLNGFRLAGDGTGGVFGVATLDNNDLGLNRVGVTVRNGTITNFVSGIVLSVSGASGDRSSEVRDIRAIGNRINGIAVGDNAMVTGSFAVSNVVGILAGQNAIVSGNTATANTQRGFVIDCPGTVVGNIATGNPTPFVVLNAVDCTFANNTPGTP